MNSTVPAPRFILSKKIILDTVHYCRCAKGDENGLWTTVVVSMVFIL